MMFSVVIPVHNGEKFIEDCLNSAIKQVKDIADAEIIIVENGSTDRTAEICDRICASDSCIKVIHEGPIGLFLARQTGIKASKGDYIMALDADDCLKPGMLSELKKTIEELKTEGKKADIILYGAADMDHPAERLCSFPFEPSRLYEKNELDPFKEVLCRDDSMNAMWIKCISRNIAYIDRDIKGLNYGEDLFQTAVYLDRADSIIYLDKTLYLYRNNAASLSASYNRAYLDNQKFVWSELDKLIAGWGNPSYKTAIDPRKALTCAIAVVKIINSSLGIFKKKAKLLELFGDEFYLQNYKNGLPANAPLEEAAIYSDMQRADALKRLLRTAFWHDLKVKVKKVIRANGI